MRLIDANVLQEQITQSKLSNPHSDPNIARNHDYEHDHFMKMVASQPTMKDHPVVVFVVSWYNAGEEPVVTAFSNEDNAMKYYSHELANGHVKVAIDVCPIYSTFYTGNFEEGLTITDEMDI